MAQKMVILGGAHCGKTDLAQDICSTLENVHWWGTGLELPQDSDWQQRLSELRATRGASWTTYEGPWSWPVPDKTTVAAGATLFVVDSLNLWLAAQINRCSALYSMPQMKTHLELEFQQLLEALRSLPCPTLVISAEVGSGVVPSGEAARLFRDLLGLWNRSLVSASEHAVSMQAGRAFYWPGGLSPLPADGVPLRVVDASFLRRLLLPHQLHK